MNKQFKRLASVAAIGLATGSAAWADDDISPAVLQQMNAIASVKAGFSPAQKKLDSALAFGLLANSGDARVAPFANAIRPLVSNDVASTVAPQAVRRGPAGTVVVDIYGSASDELAGAITAVSGTILSKSTRWGVITAAVPVGSLLQIANRTDVTKLRVSSGARTNVGSVSTQGTVSHEANKVSSILGITGAGVKVGVLSDSALPARVAALKASGDLKPSASVLPGQDGPSDGSDEGTAMMEIIQDMAPGAELIFATAFTSESSFADNILALAAAGCKVIVDDITYFDEGVFQDTIVQQAVNQVTAAGVVYLSSAGNSGSLTRATSGTWEGDFLSGGTPPAPIGAGGGLVHNFGTPGTPQNFNRLTGTTPIVIINWSDPFAASSNDYDLFILNPTGTSILAFSASVQDGTQDPQETAYLDTFANFPVNSRIVITKYAGDTRALHVDTERGVLQIATAGATFGHNAGATTVTLAATYWNSAKTGTKPFTGAANINEPFSSDGPRKMFFTQTGAPITPGNLLFSTNGGTTLQKPDFSAADGVTTRTPGFLPFFGTSAAAPHAAGIAALIRSARPDYTVEQVKTAMRATALDSMAPGVDRDSGYGVTMGYAAVQYALTH